MAVETAIARTKLVANVFRSICRPSLEKFEADPGKGSSRAFASYQVRLNSRLATKTLDVAAIAPQVLPHEIDQSQCSRDLLVLPACLDSRRPSSNCCQRWGCCSGATVRLSPAMESTA